MQGAAELNLRGTVDTYYEQIGNATFEALQTMAKMSSANAASSGGDEEKGALYAQIILIENARYLSVELGRLPNCPESVAQIFRRRADALLSDSLGSYIASVLRKPFGKMIDFADGVGLLMRSTPANEITLHAAYSKSNFKRVSKEYGSKDVRKSIETLSKRVQKHFAADEDDGPTTSTSAISNDGEEEAVVQVWRSCEGEAAKEVERFSRMIRDVLPDGSVTLDITAVDVRRLFQQSAPSVKRR